MQEIPSQETGERPLEDDSHSVAQALDSDDPDIRARGLNAALRLLFRINDLTQKRRSQEQFNREIALIRMPVTEAIQSDDPWTRSRAVGVLNGLLATLQEVSRKKQRVDQMIEQLRGEVRLARRARRGQVICASFLLVTALADFLFKGGHIALFWWLVFLLGGFWEIDISRRHTMIQRLSEAWDPQAVGVLAVVAQEREPGLNDKAQQALIHLLPRVRASDAAYIDADGMKALIALLKEEDDPLRLALLQAFEQIGDERAIPAVLELRDSPHIDTAIRQAAAECLPALENRVRLARESATLLRASSGLSPAEAAETLLRPAAGENASTDNLLRPADGLPAPPSTQAETTPPSFFSVKLPSQSVAGDTTVPSGTSLS